MWNHHVIICMHMFYCSFWKRQLETSSRYSYLVSAYKGLKRWIAKGDVQTTRMKRYIQRHLQLPPREYGLTDTPAERLVCARSLPCPSPPPKPRATTCVTILGNGHKSCWWSLQMNTFALYCSTVQMINNQVLASRLTACMHGTRTHTHTHRLLHLKSS